MEKEPIMQKRRVNDGNEVVLRDDDFLVSKTDTKGKITYANRCFMAVAGYPESDLLGKPHNLIRHQDMPRGVFRLMWKMLQNGEEFFGFVKNRCADGGFYWVFANVTADKDEKGVLQGYFSVRRKASPQIIQQVEGLYAQMRQIEAQQPGNAGVDASMAFLNRWINDNFPSFNEAMLELYRQFPAN